MIIIAFNFRGVFRNNSIWDKIVFAKVQQTLGGRVKFIATGSAPLSAKVMDFVRCATGAMVSGKVFTF